jgi:glycosyltransferase involved in cell wall biosynthesis
MYLRPVIIVVNTRLLIHNRLDGIGRFTFETLRRITQKQEDTNFVFLFDRKIHEDFIFSENITPAKIFPPARRTWLFNWWLNFSVHSVLRDLKPDLFFSPDGFLPLRGDTKCLPVIHDLNFEHYPQDIPAHYAKWYKKKFPRFVKKAGRIVTVSEFSKQDIHEQYGYDLDKIDVVHNAAADGFVPLTTEKTKSVRDKWSKGQPYFLYVGSLHPRKNLERLVRAFAVYKKKNGGNIKLVLTGPPFWKNEGMRNAVQELPDKEDVIFTGRVDEQEVRDITGAALALAYVPYFEGFGIPLVEAMACDVPVISSNVTAMPEVAGEAALYCDPFSIESIADALQSVANDATLREVLIAKGRTQRELYSWDKSADKLWNVMLKTMGHA